MFLDEFDDLILGYVLKKLADVLEEIEVSKGNSTDKTTGIIGVRQSKAANRLSGWLGRLRANPPHRVTHILIEQMQAARKLNNNLRLAAQMILLDALVEDGLAVDVASYSVVALKNV